MSNIKEVAEIIVKLMDVYGFDPSSRYYPAGTMDEVILRSVEGIKIGNQGYIHISGRDGQEYASGNDNVMAVRWNGDRPNMSYLLISSPQMTIDYFDTAMTIDRGGGETVGEWVEPAEDGGKAVIRNITFNAPINDNIYVGALVHEGGPEEDISIGQLMASILGNYMLINLMAPNRDMRYNHMIASMNKVLPTMRLSGESGQWKLPYYNIWISM